MATKAKRPLSGRTTLAAGPWAKVITTNDPYDDAATSSLVDAANCYIPDPAGESGVYSRPGFSLLFGGTPIVSSATAFRGQAVYTHTALDTTSYNFIVMMGKLFRVDPTLSIATDVTPVGVTIDPAITTRVKFLTLANNLIVSDRVNRPWLATNLASTPITGTYIDYDGSGTTWSAFDMTGYGGSVIFLLNQVNNIFRRSDIAWCEPGLPTVGYQQTGFSNFWTLEQTETTPIYAVCGTNVGMFYFRARSIGAIAGAIGPNLSSTATHDSVARNVGTQAPQSVQLYGDTIYFTDVIGRPNAFQLGGTPTNVLWKNMRAIVDASSLAFPAVTAVTTTSTFESTLNLYIVGIWSPTPSQQASVVEVFIYDAATMAYMGRWPIGGFDPGISIDSIGIFTDLSGRLVLIVLGSATVGGPNGYVWAFNALLGTPDFLTTEGGVFLTTEDGTSLITEGQTEIWMDNGAVPAISATTQRLGYNDQYVYNVDQIRAITTSQAPITISITTPTGANVVQGTATPSASADGTYRAVCGADGQGRGIQVTVSPTTATEQWSLQHVAIDVIPSLAGPEDA